jgi:Protein of unknown function (DUF4019)
MAVGRQNKRRSVRPARRRLIKYCLLPTAYCLLLSAFLACAVDERGQIPPAAQARIDEVTEDIAAGRDQKVYDEAAAEWRASVSSEENGRALERVRTRLGRVTTRSLRSGREQQQGTAELPGHTLQLVYATKFERADATETFVLVERDGRWLLARYAVDSDALK